MKMTTLAASLGAVFMSLSASASFAADADRRPALDRLQAMLEKMDGDRTPSRARLALRDLVRDMADDGIDAEDFLDRGDRTEFSFCTNGPDSNRDRLQPSFAACMVELLDEPSVSPKAGRRVTTTIRRNGSNTVYRRTIGKGHKLTTKQHGHGNRIAIVQSD